MQLKQALYQDNGVAKESCSWCAFQADGCTLWEWDTGVKAASGGRILDELEMQDVRFCTDKNRIRGVPSFTLPVVESHLLLQGSNFSRAPLPTGGNPISPLFLAFFSAPTQSCRRSSHSARRVSSRFAYARCQATRRSLFAFQIDVALRPPQPRWAAAPLPQLLLLSANKSWLSLAYDTSCSRCKASFLRLRDITKYHLELPSPFLGTDAAVG